MNIESTDCLNNEESKESIIIQFKNEKAEAVGVLLEVPNESNIIQLEELVNQLLENGKNKIPYSFYVNDLEITDSLQTFIKDNNISTEAALSITFQPLSVFRVRPVGRCKDTLKGHTEAILHVSFSPNGLQLASGGGDATVRFWDLNTCTPKNVCRGHTHHVLCTAWSPDCKRFVSGDKNGEIRIWNPTTGEQIGSAIKAHKQWITSFSFEPMHRNVSCERFASSSKDGSIKIWNTRTGRIVASLSGHLDSVECVKWGGQGLLYSASRDRSIKVWSVEGEHVGKLVRTLIGHGHRINILALNVDYVCRSGPYDYKNTIFSNDNERQDAAKKRYEEICPNGESERLVSGSDDFTLFLWEPTISKKPIQRMTGHVQPINDICFSPDGRFIASASFDKKIKIWDGKTGIFKATLNGHVGAVYRIVWSSDSRLLVSASKDSTLKLWELQNLKQAKNTLPGHEDEVYALDWSPNGEQVASGSKDRTIKIWQH